MREVVDMSSTSEWVDSRRSKCFLKELNETYHLLEWIIHKSQKIQKIFRKLSFRMNSLIDEHTIDAQFLILVKLFFHQNWNIPNFEITVFHKFIENKLFYEIETKIDENYEKNEKITDLRAIVVSKEYTDLTGNGLIKIA